MSILSSLLSTVREYWKQVISFNWNRVCILCLHSHQNKIDICNYCLQTLPQLQSSCHGCGLNLIVEPYADIFCGKCIQYPPPYHQLYIPWKFEESVRDLITRTKFSSDLIAADILGKLFIPYLIQQYNHSPLPQMIIPIPLHKQRLQQRGFNQALEIARPIAKYFHIPINTNSCYRIKNTSAQSLLSAKLRDQNIKRAFNIAEPVTADHIAIIDDVFTTGNTIREFCNTLLKHKKYKIDVWCCARTM